MAKIQYPIDGKLGKDFKITSNFGWRIHPIQKYRKHHNGVDLWSAKEPCYIEAIADGEVLEARMSTAANGGYGWYVRLLHKIDGEWYTSTYAHMVANSLKVTKGQKVVAGTVLGKMGTTGNSTGKHLHIEINKGKKYVWTSDGKGFVDPLPFIKALMDKEAVVGAAPEATPENAIVEDAPIHGEKPKPVKFAAPSTKPKLAGWLKKGSNSEAVAYLQKVLGVTVDGQFGAQTEKAVKKFQADNGLKVDGLVGSATWKKIPTSFKTAPAKPTVVKKTYKVKSGDTLGKIAKQHGTTVAKLAKLNNIKNVNLIKVGQSIKLS